MLLYSLSYHLSVFASNIKTFSSNFSHEIRIILILVLLIPFVKFFLEVVFYRALVHAILKRCQCPQHGYRRTSIYLSIKIFLRELKSNRIFSILINSIDGFKNNSTIKYRLTISTSPSLSLSTSLSSDASSKVVDHRQSVSKEEDEESTCSLCQACNQRMFKMVEALWKLNIYGLFVTLEYFAAIRQPWFKNTRDQWVGWPNQEISPTMRVLYASQLSFYIATALVLFPFEPTRRDALVMQTHHVCTAVLVTLAYTCGYIRMGSTIMVVHDINDVIMEVAKCFNYTSAAHPWAENVAKTFLGLFVVTWVLLRMYYFPRYILRSTLFEIQEVLGMKPQCYWLINGLFGVLFLMHVYWFGLILRTVYMTLRSGRTHDVREKKDDE